MPYYFSFFFFNDTATTEIYTLSLHDALPISCSNVVPTSLTTAASRFGLSPAWSMPATESDIWRRVTRCATRDRKSTRLNSSHSQISYAVFCLKKKKKNKIQ